MARAQRRPRCFDTEGQYLAWRDAARSTRLPMTEFCTDCTADYQRRMTEQGRCAYPRRQITSGSDAPRQRREAIVYVFA
jgi:hypothetical protein